MKKKLIIVGIIVVILSAIIIVVKINEARKEEHARNILLTWLHDIEPEEIEIFSFSKPNPDDKYHPEYIEPTEYQKNRVCELLKSISADEVSLGPNVSETTPLTVSIVTIENEDWVFKFDGDVIYIRGMPDELTEEAVDERWFWEIRNEKLNAFLTEVLEEW